MIITIYFFLKMTNPFGVVSHHGGALTWGCSYLAAALGMPDGFTNTAVHRGGW